MTTQQAIERILHLHPNQPPAKVAGDLANAWKQFQLRTGCTRKTVTFPISSWTTMSVTPDYDVDKVVWVKFIDNLGAERELDEFDLMWYMDDEKGKIIIEGSLEDETSLPAEVVSIYYGVAKRSEFPTGLSDDFVNAVGPLERFSEAILHKVLEQYSLEEKDTEMASYYSRLYADDIREAKRWVKSNMEYNANLGIHNQVYPGGSLDE